jgi:hypothetical protein
MLVRGEGKVDDGGIFPPLGNAALLSGKSFSYGQKSMNKVKGMEVGCFSPLFSP